MVASWTVSPEDLYDLLALDQRTDRVLPNGLCMLPPRETGNRGNACLSCTKFVTDASFLGEHRAQHGRLLDLLTARDAAHRERTGRPMSEENVWKRERLRERQAHERIIAKLERDGLTGQAVRTPGVPR